MLFGVWPYKKDFFHIIWLHKAATVTANKQIYLYLKSEGQSILNRHSVFLVTPFFCLILKEIFFAINYC